MPTLAWNGTSDCNQIEITFRTQQSHNALVRHWSVLLALTAAGCAAATSSSGAPPTAICGQTIYSGAGGLGVYDAWKGSKPPAALAPIPAGKQLPDFVLRTAPGCDHGAHLTVSPPRGLVFTGTAHAADGQVVAVAVQGGAQGRVSLTVDDGSHQTTLHFTVGVTG